MLVEAARADNARIVEETRAIRKIEKGGDE